MRADDGMGFLLKYENVAWYEDGRVRILDRRVYPRRIEYVTCTGYRQVAQAIADMVTQSGGPYTAAVMGLALAASQAGPLSGEKLCTYLKEAARCLSSARPTTRAGMEAVLKEPLEIALKGALEGACARELAGPIKEAALAQLERRYRKYRRVADFLAEKIPPGGTVLTQCFAETVVGMLILACRERGNMIRMICAETRPYLQGARLTASVACEMGVDVHVITDNMPAFIMKEKKVDIFTSAADVITMDGHVVNKVGTFQIALAAAWHGIPYYVTGTPDRAHPDLSTVEIEYRDPAQVLSFMGIPVAMEGVGAYYPAFDCTPPALVSGVVTDRGIFLPDRLCDYPFGA